MADENIDPRYDPAFQRGYDRSGPRDARRATEPDETDAPVPRIPPLTGRRAAASDGGGVSDDGAVSDAAVSAEERAAFGRGAGSSAAGGSSATGAGSAAPRSEWSLGGSPVASGSRFAPGAPSPVRGTGGVTASAQRGTAGQEQHPSDDLRARAEAAARGDLSAPGGAERDGIGRDHAGRDDGGRVVGDRRGGRSSGDGAAPDSYGVPIAAERRDIRRNPFLWAVLAVGVVLILAGAAMFRDLGEQLSDTGTRTAANYLQVQFELSVGPLALAVGIAAVLAVGLVYAVDWLRR